MNAVQQLPRVLRNKFIAGLIILVPIVVTARALWWLFSYIDRFAQPLSHALLRLETPIPGTGFALTGVVVLLTGALFSTGPLRKVRESLEDALEYVPVIGPVFSTIKKVLEGFGSPAARQAFQRFVLARLPGRTTPGFLTGSFVLRLADGSERSLCTVYIPTNHLYIGDVVVLPREDVIETDLSVEEGISVMLSAGSAVPETVGERAS
jgi:uncharacterized membrane protein